MLEMNDIILIFIGIFVILLIFLFFMLVAYVYDTYTSYKIDINKNLTKSEDHINKTSKSIDTLQDNVNSNISNIKNNYDTIKTNYNTLETNNNTYTSNLNHLIEIKNKEKNIGSNLFNDNITAYNKNDIDLNLLTNFSLWEDTIIHTSSNNSNYLNICDNLTGNKSNLHCASMNVNDKIFNIYSSNNKFNSSNIDKIQIHGKKYDDTMIEFDINNNNVKLGSNINPAILISNNIYTPPTISGSYTLDTSSSTAGTLKINFYTNILIPSNVFINFHIPTTNSITSLGSIPSSISNATYTAANKLLKFNVSNNINANTFTGPLDIPIIGTSLTSISTPISINGFITER